MHAETVDSFRKAESIYAERPCNIQIQIHVAAVFNVVAVCHQCCCSCTYVAAVAVINVAAVALMTDLSTQVGFMKESKKPIFKVVLDFDFYPNPRA